MTPLSLPLPSHKISRRWTIPWHALIEFSSSLPFSLEPLSPLVGVRCFRVFASTHAGINALRVKCAFAQALSIDLRNNFQGRVKANLWVFTSKSERLDLLLRNCI